VVVRTRGEEKEKRDSAEAHLSAVSQRRSTFTRRRTLNTLAESVYALVVDAPIAQEAPFGFVRCPVSRGGGEC
jgi:hypothetical protein